MLDLLERGTLGVVDDGNHSSEEGATREMTNLFERTQWQLMGLRGEQPLMGMGL